MRPAGSCVLHGAVARPCVPVTRREVSPSGLLGHQTRGTSPTHGFLAGTWRAQGSGPRGHAHRPALQALHQNRPHWGVYLHFSFFFILAHEFLLGPSLRYTQQRATTRGDNHKSLQHPPQRHVTTRPTVRITPPSRGATSLIHGRKHAISAVAGGGYLKSGFQDLELSHRRDLRTSAHPAPSRRRQPRGFCLRVLRCVAYCPLSLDSPPPVPFARMSTWRIAGLCADLEDAQRSAAGTTPSQGIFLALSSPQIRLDSGYHATKPPILRSGPWQMRSPR